MQNVFFPDGKQNSWPLTNTKNKAYILFCAMWFDKTDKHFLFGKDGDRYYVEEWTKYFKDRAEKLRRATSRGLLFEIKNSAGRIHDYNGRIEWYDAKWFQRWGAQQKK